MIRSTKRRRLAALLALGGLTAGAAVMTAGSAQALPTFAITRIAGPDRAATAAQIAGQTFPGGATNAIIVREDEFADALAGNYIAGAVNGPLLLTKTNSVPATTLQALDTLNVTHVTLLGGTTAISASVEVALKTVLGEAGVSRIAGADRFDTAARVAAAASLLPTGVGTIGAERVAVVSSGRNFADALSAGPMVFSEHLPQLLTEVNSLPAATLTSLQALDIDRVILTGGTVAVSEAVRDQIAGAGMTVTRIFGDTRYHTSFQLAVFAGTNFGYEADHVNFATGNNFPDALAGGPHGGTENAPILLTPTVGGPEATFVCDSLEALASSLLTAHVFGGTAAVPDATVDALETCGQGTGGPAAGTGQVVTVTNGSDQYSFVQTSNNTEVTVTHDAQDTFRVDGVAVNQAVFETNITPGDTITFTDDATATDADVHELTNVVLTAGMVGNVDTAANTFDIINPVTGDDVGGWTWNEAADTFGGAVGAFENAISEGDGISVTVVASDPTAFALTNAAVTGAVAVPTADATEADMKVGVFGDEAENAQNDTFNAAAANNANEDYVVDGASATYEQFRLALSQGDTLSVTRADVAGVSIETFTLTNVAPPAITGQLFYLFETREDNANPPAGTGGDRLALIPAAGGYVEVDYTNNPGAGYKVDGVVVDEAGFEAALSAGDTITFQPGSTTPAVPQTLSLTNAALSGQWAGINTAGDFYGVFAADKATLLAFVDYVGAGTPPLTNQYFINGTQRTLTDWEALAADVLVAGDLDDTISIDVAGGFRNHRLTTTDTLTP